jgi:hypothetical protein
MHPAIDNCLNWDNDDTADFLESVRTHISEGTIQITSYHRTDKADHRTYMARMDAREIVKALATIHRWDLRLK